MLKKILLSIPLLCLAFTSTAFASSQPCSDWFILNYVYEPSPNSIVVNYTVSAQPSNPSQAPMFSYCRSNINYDGILMSNSVSDFDFTVGTHSLTYTVGGAVGNIGFEYDAGEASQCLANNITPRPSVWQITAMPLIEGSMQVCNGFTMPIGLTPGSFGFMASVKDSPQDFYSDFSEMISQNALKIVGIFLVFGMLFWLLKFFRFTISAPSQSSHRTSWDSFSLDPPEQK